MKQVEFLIIGAGFGGLGIAMRLLQRGEKDFQIWEKADGLGGVWRDNTYPGAACDIPSHLYSYSFAPKKDWSHRFARQSEILQYMQDCVTDHNLQNHLYFQRDVVQATFDENTRCWLVQAGDGTRIQARYLVTATGQLNRPMTPAIEGRDTFKGEQFHSAQWRHDVSLKGKRVAVIGTGASAIQFVPEIAKDAAQVQLFQRSAPYVIPKPDKAYSASDQALMGRLPKLQALSRAKTYLLYETRLIGFRFSELAMPLVRRQWQGYMHSQIKDPQLRKTLTPNYPMGCKRVLLANNYYKAMARDNVSVHTMGVDRIDERGIVDREGEHHDVDVIIFATGFKATEFLAPMSVVGAQGTTLNEAWKDGAEAYLGISVHGFPNLFMLYGPNTNLGHNSIIYMLESQIQYVLDAVKYQRKHKIGSVDVLPSTQRKFNARVQKQIKSTVWDQGCHSWYITDDGKNTVNWPGFTFNYRRRTRHFNPNDYQLTPID